MNRAKILVIGRNGQLALALAERGARRGLEIVSAGRPELDLLDPAKVEKAVADSRADIVVNAAAYTAVDRAESEPEEAEALNARVPALLAAAAAKTGSRLIHVSTDYVFDGEKEAPYREEDPTAPVGIYGRTKLAGEEAVRSAGGEHGIVRTSWVYSPFGSNFVKTMLSAASARPQLRVVGDQIGNPTSALDLADGILAIVEAWRGPERGAGGTWHLAGTGSTSWAGFAREIFRISGALGGPWAEVISIETAEWPTPARRPANSRLDSGRFAAMFGYAAPEWPDSLASCVTRLLPSASAVAG
jgi:dTDP-4-dehydrorhamnose reductase